MKRRELVRMAGESGRKRSLLFYLRQAMDRAHAAFAMQLAARYWGHLPKLPTRKVSVPRSLRHRFGRYVEDVKTNGRKRKDRRKHNRRWMPERDDCDR